jgi:general secretion pathway protein A
LEDLVGIESDGQKLISILFVGQNEDNEILKNKLENSLKQKIAVHHHLNPLNETETQLMIQHRLEVAGGRIAMIDPQAIQYIYGFSAGYPRLINSICDQALLAGYANGIKKIYKGAIKECATKLGLEMQKS